MITVNIKIKKSDVYAEVEKTTGYTGAKMDGDGNAYDRIQTTDDDKEVLERFWDEACSATVTQFRQFVTQATTDTTGDFNVGMELSSAYDETLTPSVETSLTSYFVGYIVGKWYKFTNKGESEAYLADAKRMMDDVVAKVYYRKKPKRPTLS